MTATATKGGVQCPKCGGEMWDNRPKKAAGEFKPSAPDFKCKDKNCDGVIWPPRNPANARRPAPVNEAPPQYGDLPEVDEHPQEDEAQARIEKLNRLFAFYRVCFDEALKFGEKAAKAGYVVTMEGLSAAAATLMIQSDKRGLLP